MQETQMDHPNNLSINTEYDWSNLQLTQLKKLYEPKDRRHHSRDEARGMGHMIAGWGVGGVGWLGMVGGLGHGEGWGWGGWE